MAPYRSLVVLMASFLSEQKKALPETRCADKVQQRDILPLLTRIVCWVM